jgi:cytochrome c oxidase subunit 3
MARDFGLAGLFRPDQATLPEVNEDRKLRLGMFFYVMADLFTAIFLIGVYVFLRGYDTNGRWFPPGSKTPDMTQVTVVTIITVLGSVAYAVGSGALKGRSLSLFRYAMLVSALLFLGDGVYQLWSITHLPFDQTVGSYGSSFVLLAGYHAYHMLIATFLGVGVVIRAFRGYYDKTEYVPDGPHAPSPEYAQRNTSGIASIGYYQYYAALYAIAFWLLLVIQPIATH